MDWKGLGKAITKAAPLLGSVVGSVVPGVGTAVGGGVGALLASAFGGDPEDPTSLAQAIKQTPDAVLKLREIDTRHKEALEALLLENRKVALEEHRADLADRAGARERDLQLRAGGDKNTRANLMIVGDLVGLIACLVAMVYAVAAKVDGLEVLIGPLGILIGHFGTGLTAAHQFEFGSSRGSKEKDRTVAAEFLSTLGKKFIK